MVKARVSGEVLGKCNRRVSRGLRGRHVAKDHQRKLRTSGGSPRQGGTCTAKASRISRSAAKLGCARNWGGWGRLSVDGPGQHNPDRSEGPWGRAAKLLEWRCSSAQLPRHRAGMNRFESGAHEGGMQTRTSATIGRLFWE